MALPRLLCAASILIALGAGNFLESGEPEWLNKAGGSFNFTCPEGQAITSMESDYTHKLLHKDRKWAFKVVTMQRGDLGLSGFSKKMGPPEVF